MDRGRTPTREVVPYIVFQVAGAIAAAAVLKIMADLFLAVSPRTAMSI